MHELVFAHNRVYSEGGEVFDVSSPSAPTNLGKLPTWGGTRPLPNDPTRVLLGSFGQPGTGAIFRMLDAATRTTKAMVTIAAATSYYTRDLDLMGNDSVAFLSVDNPPPGAPLDPERPNLLIVARLSLLP